MMGHKKRFPRPATGDMKTRDECGKLPGGGTRRKSGKADAPFRAQRRHAIQEIEVHGRKWSKVDVFALNVSEKIKEYSWYRSDQCLRKLAKDALPLKVTKRRRMRDISQEEAGFMIDLKLWKTRPESGDTVNSQGIIKEVLRSNMTKNTPLKIIDPPCRVYKHLTVHCHGIYSKVPA
jgi:hypothetical protein